MGRICRDNKPALVIGIVVSVLMLGYFKYANFFITEFGNIVGKDMVLLDIILPLGISFYTFSGISYLIDIYRGEYEAVKNPVDVALYIAFFTKITAGPIVRGKDFFPQLKSYRGIRAAEASEGIQIFVNDLVIVGLVFNNAWSISVILRGKDVEVRAIIFAMNAAKEHEKVRESIGHVRPRCRAANLLPDVRM